jgi:hypothetical protein
MDHIEFDHVKARGPDILSGICVDSNKGLVNGSTCSYAKRKGFNSHLL